MSYKNRLQKLIQTDGEVIVIPAFGEVFHRYSTNHSDEPVPDCNAHKRYPHSDREVMLLSEAQSAGFLPCDHCFAGWEITRLK